MPNRIIKESARTSATLFRLSDGAERMFWRLVTVADDFGRFEADPRILKAACFPLWGDRIKIDRVGRWFGEMVACGLVQAYACNGKQYGFFTTWDRHQQKRAKHSKYPDPTPESICQQPLANVPENRESNTRNEKREAGPKPPPAAENGSGPDGPSHPPVQFQIPDSITKALERAPRLGRVPRLREPPYWQAQVRSRPGVDFGGEILEAEAWMTANPAKAPKSDFPAFLNNWLRRAYERRTGGT